LSAADAVGDRVYKSDFTELQSALKRDRVRLKRILRL